MSIYADRFRFNAWDKKHKKMYYEVQYGLYALNFSDLLELDDFGIIRCTGLKDKNGKLIFEGDIIKVPDNYNEFGQFAGEKYEIYFKAGGFRFKPKFDEKARGCWLEDNNTFEIIGNIYENRELLENKNGQKKGKQT